MPALEVSLGNDLQRVDVEREIGNDTFQPPVFVFESAQLRYVADLKATVFGLPLVKRVRADAVFTAQIFRVRAGLGFFDDADDLGFSKT